jgi:hypothetical protein
MLLLRRLPTLFRDHLVAARAAFRLQSTKDEAGISRLSELAEFSPGTVVAFLRRRCVRPDRRLTALPGDRSPPT